MTASVTSRDGLVTVTEELLFAVSDDWRAAADALDELVQELAPLADEATKYMEGDAADAFSTFWNQFVDDAGNGHVADLRDLCVALSEASLGAGLDIEYTKLSIYASIAMLAAAIGQMTAAAFATGGTSLNGIPIAQQATKQFIERLVLNLLKSIAKDVAINLAVDGLIQGGQLLLGRREEWDSGKSEAAFQSGVASGAAGGLMSSVPYGSYTVAGGAAKGAARGAAEGVLANAINSALDGEPVGGRTRPLRRVQLRYQLAERVRCPRRAGGHRGSGHPDTRGPRPAATRRSVSDGVTVRG